MKLKTKKGYVMKRKQLSKKKSDKIFKKSSGVKSVKIRNYKLTPMRGGTRA